MSQTATQRLRDAGALTDSKWAALAERMRWKMEEIQKWLVDNPGSKLSEVGYGVQITKSDTTTAHGHTPIYPTRPVRTCCLGRSTKT